MCELNRSTAVIVDYQFFTFSSLFVIKLFIVIVLQLYNTFHFITTSPTPSNISDFIRFIFIKINMSEQQDASGHAAAPNPTNNPTQDFITPLEHSPPTSPPPAPTRPSAVDIPPDKDPFSDLGPIRRKEVTPKYLQPIMTTLSSLWNPENSTRHLRPPLHALKPLHALSQLPTQAALMTAVLGTPLKPPPNHYLCIYLFSPVGDLDLEKTTTNHLLSTFSISDTFPF